MVHEKTGDPFLIREVHAAGYRSLRSIRFPVAQLTVFLGGNGVGKSNLYKCLQLLRASASGTLSAELAGEGGMASALWAGRRRAGHPARIVLEAGFGGDISDADGAGITYSYRVSAGLAAP